MVLDSSDARDYQLVARDLKVNQPADMNLFVIKAIEFVNVTQPKNGTEMRITFRRKIMSEIMTTFFPSLLLMMITFATTFFKPYFFEAALTVNLTTMLVMTTIFISKMESLPPTSATKMIDYWLILCQLVPFAQVVLLTIKENLREEEQEENLYFEKDQIKLPTITNDNSEVDVEDDINPREAWTMSEIKHSKGSTLKMLSMLGKVLLGF